MNRQERRRESKRLEAEMRIEAIRHRDPQTYFGAKVKVMDELSRNGITPQDMEREYKRGYDDGARFVSERIGTMYVAAMCMALHDMHGFAKKRLIDLMDRMNEIMLETFTTEEAMQQLFDQLGLKFADGDTFHPLQEK